jgi:hypothetical protein
LGQYILFVALKLEVDTDEDNNEAGEQNKNREMNICNGRHNGQHNDQEMPENTENSRGESHGSHK